MNQTTAPLALIAEDEPVLARTLSLMGVSGRIQSADGVSHVIIDSIWEPRLSRLPVPSPSHDFH